MRLIIDLKQSYEKIMAEKKRREADETRKLRLLESKWSEKMIPKTRENVEKYPNCFLRPNPDNPGYPICDKRTKTPQCEGLLAAYKRAAQQHARQIESKAKSLAKSLKCDWAD